MEIAIVMVVIVLILGISYVINYLKFRAEQMMYSSKGCGCGVVVIILVVLILFFIFAMGY